MRILICDDDTNIIQQLQNYIIEYFGNVNLKVPEIIAFEQGEALLAAATADDIIFLDIELPDKSGIYVGRELKNRYKDLIIFIITSYTEYLDDAMRFSIFRYILKPIDKKRLFRNMKDALFLYNSTNIKVPVNTKEAVYTVNVSDIIYVEAQGRTVTVYTTDETYISLNNMAYWADTLNMPCFFQSHRSYIVNMKYVSKFNHFLIYLCDNQYTAYLTKRKYTQFKDHYFLYLESTR